MSNKGGSGREEECGVNAELVVELLRQKKRQKRRATRGAVLDIKI